MQSHGAWFLNLFTGFSKSVMFTWHPIRKPKSQIEKEIRSVDARRQFVHLQVLAPQWPRSTYPSVTNWAAGIWRCRWLLTGATHGTWCPLKQWSYNHSTLNPWANIYSSCVQHHSRTFAFLGKVSLKPRGTFDSIYFQERVWSTKQIILYIACRWSKYSEPILCGFPYVAHILVESGPLSSTMPPPSHVEFLRPLERPRGDLMWQKTQKETWQQWHLHIVPHTKQLKCRKPRKHKNNARSAVAPVAI